MKFEKNYYYHYYYYTLNIVSFNGNPFMKHLQYELNTVQFKFYCNKWNQLPNLKIITVFEIEKLLRDHSKST